MLELNEKSLKELENRKVKLSRFEVKVEFPMAQSLMFQENRNDANYFRSYFVVHYLRNANNEVIHKLFSNVVLVMDYIIKNGFSAKIYPSNSTKDTLEFTFSFKTISEYLDLLMGMKSLLEIIGLSTNIGGNNFKIGVVILLHLFFYIFNFLIDSINIQLIYNIFCLII